MNDTEQQVLRQLIRAGIVRFQQQGDIGFPYDDYDCIGDTSPFFKGAERAPYALDLVQEIPSDLIEEAGQLQAQLLCGLNLGNPRFVMSPPGIRGSLAKGFLTLAGVFGWRSSLLRYKKQGTALELEDALPVMDPGDRVAIPDHILGLSTVEKLRLMRALPTNLDPHLIFLIDRMEGGMAILEALGIRAHAVFTLEDVLVTSEAERVLNRRTISKADVRAYAAHREQLVMTHLQAILKNLRAVI